MIVVVFGTVSFTDEGGYDEFIVGFEVDEEEIASSLVLHGWEKKEDGWYKVLSGGWVVKMVKKTDREPDFVVSKEKTPIVLSWLLS